MSVNVQQIIDAVNSEDGKKYPIESKVWSQLAGTGTGGVLSTLILWIIGVTAYNVPNTTEDAINAISAVPFPISGSITAVLALGLGLVSGYFAKHNPRINELIQQALAEAAKQESNYSQTNYITVDPAVTEPAPEELDAVTPDPDLQDESYPYDPQDTTDPEVTQMVGDEVQDNDGESTDDFDSVDNPDDDREPPANQG